MCGELSRSFQATQTAATGTQECRSSLLFQYLCSHLCHSPALSKADEPELARTCRRLGVVTSTFTFFSHKSVSEEPVMEQRGILPSSLVRGCWRLDAKPAEVPGSFSINFSSSKLKSWDHFFFFHQIYVLDLLLQA